MSETLLRHWELKLLALALSTAIWFFVATRERDDVILTAPVEVQGLPAGLALAGDVPGSVDVQVQGPRGALARLSPDQVRAQLDLSAARPGEVVLALGPDQVRTPSGITVLRVMPSRIRVVVAASATPPRTQPRPEAPRS